MVKYPIVKPGAKGNAAKKATVRSGKITGQARDTSAYKNRGMRFEELIEKTCEFYLIHDLAVIHKRPTPIQVVSFRNEKSKYAISEAYFKTASTTDYNGIYRGKYLDFEAKETKNHAWFNLDNLQKHQLDHMLQVKRHGGIAFVLVCFWRVEEVYLIDAEHIAKFYLDPNCSSIPIRYFRAHAVRVGSSYVKPVDFLPAIDQMYLDEKKEEQEEGGDAQTDSQVDA